MQDKKTMKYESLKNNFLIFDFYDQPYEKSIQKIKKLSLEEKKPKFYGQKTDGILIIYKIDENKPGIKMFNSDGSDGGLCLNGARCVAYHLKDFHKFPEIFKIFMGKNAIETIAPADSDLITQKIPAAKSFKQISVEINDGEKNFLITGDFVDIGNPHFIIFENKNIDWLEKYGKKIENHKNFPNKTNVEIFWNNSMLVHERGCGITKACSSGAAAVTSVLFLKNMIEYDQDVTISMPGGEVTTLVDRKNMVVLKARAKKV